MIDEETVERTWREVAQISPDRAAKEMELLTEKQPNLLAYVMAHAAEMEPQAQELAVYLFFAVYRMFETAAGRTVETVSEDAILAQIDETESFLEGLEWMHERFFERAAEVQSARQPHVMGYVVAAILEAPDDDPSLVFSEEDEGLMFLILKTVIDVLDLHTTQS